MTLEQEKECRNAFEIAFGVWSRGVAITNEEYGTYFSILNAAWKNRTEFYEGVIANAKL